MQDIVEDVDGDNETPWLITNNVDEFNNLWVLFLKLMSGYMSERIDCEL